jgi:hypothetical protein
MPLCQESNPPTHQRKPYGLTDHIINSIKKYKKGECYFANKIRNCNKTKAPFGWADKPAEKHCWLICCERKILFRLKKQAEKDGL